MSRSVALLILVLASGCSSPQKRNVMLPDGPETTGGGEQNEGVVEAEGCMPETSTEIPTTAQMVAVGPAEESLTIPRTAFSSHCGAAIGVAHDWPMMFRSSGYDAGEPLDAIAGATGVFMDATRAYCEGADGAKFRESVKSVLVTPTDTPERVGACFDADSRTLVVRVMLEYKSKAVTYWEGDQFVQFYGENL